MSSRPDVRESEVYEAAGYWWSADSPDSQVPGVLRLAGVGKYALTTIGSLGQPFGVPGTLADVTVHGICGGTKFTLLRAHMSKQQNQGIQSGTTAETWMSFEMVRGSHLLPSTRFKSATFRCSGLSRIWGRWRNIPEDNPDAGYEVGAVLPEVGGCEVKIFRNRMSELGLGRSSYKDHIGVQVSAEEGLTLDELDRKFIIPFRAFAACVTGKASEVSHKNLWEILDERDEQSGARPKIVEVDPWSSLGSDEEYRESLISENDVFFQDLLTRWFELSGKLLNAMVVAAPRSERSYLEMETFAAVGAIEQVQRTVTEDQPTPLADALKEKLAEHRELLKLNSDDRSKIVHAVRLSEFTLQQRLEHLLGGNYESFFGWFLRESMKEWAEVSAKVRNRLGHGLALPEGQSENYVLLMDVFDTARNVIVLRLLLECGFPQEELKVRMEGTRDWEWQVERSGTWPGYQRAIAANGN